LEAAKPNASLAISSVTPTATKPDVKDAVEFLFSKKVKSVRIVNVKPKVRNFRGIAGTKKGLEKGVRNAATR